MTDSPAIVITTRSAPPRKVGGGLDDPTPTRARIDAAAEVARLRERLADAEAQHATTATAAEQALARADALTAELAETRDKLARALATVRQADTTRAVKAVSDLQAELAAIRRELTGALPANAKPPASTERLARLVATMARSTTRSTRGFKPWDPTPAAKPAVVCPPPTDDERWWADGRPEHLAPFACRWCGRAIFVLRHLETHEAGAIRVDPAELAAPALPEAA